MRILDEESGRISIVPTLRLEPSQAERDREHKANEMSEDAVMRLTGLTHSEIENRAYGFPTGQKRTVTGIGSVYTKLVFQKDDVVRWCAAIKTLATRLK